jgi:predicted esterase
VKLHHLTVQRTARFATLGDMHNEVRQVWFVCHGYSQLASEFIKYFAVLDDGTRLIVAPEGLSRFYLQGTRGRIGASWMTKEDRHNEIDDYVHFLDATYQHISRQVSLAGATVHILGFSQGATTASRWISRGTVPAAQLILWAGTLPPELDDEGWERIRGLRVTVVYGTDDEYVTPEAAAEQRARLEAHDVHFEEITFDGEHRMDRRTLEAIGGITT